jgi:hypothetical protein
MAARSRHQVGIGRTHAATPIVLLVAGHDIRVIHTDTDDHPQW